MNSTKIPDGWRTDVRPGYRTKAVKIGNATVQIHRPILSEEEQHKREKQLLDAVIQFERSGSNGF